MSNTANVNTPYDDAFRTILTECKELIIPVVNEIFGTKFTGKESIKVMSNERFLPQQGGAQTKKVTDSYFEIWCGDKVYCFHIECQSSEDGTMVLRMFEYDAQIVAERSVIEGNTMKIEFPESALIYLRQTKDTPDEMNVILSVGNNSIMYQMPVLKIKNYRLEEIFNKKLFFLLPFYIFKFEHEFHAMNTSEEKLSVLQQEYVEIGKRLSELVQTGQLTEYQRQTILDMSKKAVEALTNKFAKVKEGVLDVMGGKILEYEARTIMNEGRAEGEEAKAIEIALNLLAKKILSDEQIASVTGLSVEKVKELKPQKL